MKIKTTRWCDFGIGCSKMGKNFLVKERAKCVDTIVKERRKCVNSIVIQWVSPYANKYPFIPTKSKNDCIQITVLYSL